jgi:hypothetical protein
MEPPSLRVEVLTRDLPNVQQGYQPHGRDLQLQYKQEYLNVTLNVASIFILYLLVTVP